MAVEMRCAIYTRKSVANRTEFDVNSLLTQREVCQAYIKCQAHRNWVELPHHYDDEGFSGGNLERPGIRRLLDDIEAGRVDMVVVYKIDRLSRSLADFIRLLDVLEKYGTGFVSVTQTFDTSDSMGRLVLNILLTFAQFERELASDRIRDKRASLMKRGLFTGGTPPFGYKLSKGGVLIVDPERAHWVREIFERFPTVPAQPLARDLKARGCMTSRFVTKAGKERGGRPMTTNQVIRILTNPIYVGYIVHRGEWIKAKVEPLVPRDRWDLVQEIRRTRFPHRRDPVRNFLLGILHDEQGRRMKIQRGTGHAREERHYKSEYTSWSCDGRTRRIMVAADRVEQLTISALRALLADRVQLKEAILSLGLYSDEIAKRLKMGKRASRRLEVMDRVQLRSLLLALVPRAEVNTSELRLYVSCFELSNFLAWDGVGVFSKSVVRPSRAADRVHLVHAPAFLVCGHPRFAFPLDRCEVPEAEPKPWLVDLLHKGVEMRRFAFENRDKSLAELAHAKRVRPADFARLLRINYLAPDIQAAILDGTQPDSLTAWDILKGPMPLDWDHQRQLLGFA